MLVVSGFLGSGKTTLVRHLLEDAIRGGIRVAIVSNEFGALGIDRALLGQEGEAYVEIEGGCVCCKLSDELVETLQLLRERVRPDRVIVETSGVALPYDTQLNFWREPVVSWIGDDLAVVVVDAEQVAAARDLEGTFEDQVSSADLLLLNKLDLVETGQLDRIEQTLEGLAPGTPVIRAIRGAVDPALLFPPDPRGRRASRPEARAEPHSHDAFCSEELQVEPGISETELAERLRGLGALRAKGFVRTSEGLRVVQGVGTRIEFGEVVADPPPALLGRVVVVYRRARSD